MSINTSKPVQTISYNGTLIPLANSAGGGTNSPSVKAGTMYINRKLVGVEDGSFVYDYQEGACCLRIDAPEFDNNAIGPVLRLRFKSSLQWPAKYGYIFSSDGTAWIGDLTYHEVNGSFMYYISLRSSEISEIILNSVSFDDIIQIGFFENYNFDDAEPDAVIYEGIPEKVIVDSAPPVEPIKYTITDAGYLFAGQIPEEACQEFKINNPTTMQFMYYMNDAIPNVDMTQLDFTPNPNKIPLNNMFYLCDKVKSVKLPSGVKASSLMSMFQGCASLERIDLNGIDISACSDYRSFFNGCKLLTEFDGAMLPNLSVANNNTQNFFYGTVGMRKVWIPKEWKIPPTGANYSPFIANGGSGKMNPNLQIFTDATSEADQISAGKWTSFTMIYKAGAAIPAAQMHYGSTHAEYEAY